jgi:hypothetical protein
MFKTCSFHDDKTGRGQWPSRVMPVMNLSEFGENTAA